MRYVASVRLANKTLAGKFDWLLMGDDDVVWFVDHVREMLDGLDSSVPYFISDNIGGCCPAFPRGCGLPDKSGGVEAE